MNRISSTILTLICSLFFSKGMSQIVLEPLHDIEVSDGQNLFATPWIGGLNAGQYNKADLDGDGAEELIIYDRSSRTYQIFKQDNQNYVSANELCVFLPEVPDGWILFVDYDQDGKKDIFSNGERGIIVYRNTTAENQTAQWEKVADPLLTAGFSGNINLIANASDVPAITDIDGDGDIDILVYNFAVGGYIRFNKNLSQDRYGHSDSLQYEIYTRSWGEFEECECNLFAFNGETCSDLSGGRVTHPGGKALLAFDSDGDGDKDLLVGHEQCVELYFYENMGDQDSAYMVDYSNVFPEPTTPANFHIFPAAYFEDLDFDGVKDLVVTPSFEENYEFKIDFTNSNWFYKNTNADDYPDFSYQNSEFMQQNGIDLGENAAPAFADLDGDDKQDLLVAANGFWNGEHFSGYVSVFSNSGTAEDPSFALTTDDYLNISSLKLVNPTGQFVDFTGDGSPDLIYSGFVLRDFEKQSWLIPNNASAGQAMDFDINARIQIQLPDDASIGDTPHFFDVDSDGYPDLLLGKQNGALEYYRNKSDNTFQLEDPAFLGIEIDFSRERLYLVAAVGDLDQDGKSDLMVTDASGLGRIYFEFQDQVDETPESISMVYKNSLTEMEEHVKFDSKTWLTSCDIFNQGNESIIAGGVRGGLQIFRNTSIGNGGNNPNALEVRLYPNPLFDSEELNIKSNQDATIELYSVLGQKMRESFSVKMFSRTILDVGNLRNGPYILRTISDGGSAQSQLFLIQR
jgi:hypothetical protein